MFSKITSYFSKPSNPQMPLDHPKVEGKESASCPFMNKKQKAVEADDSQDEKPRGGCPMMGTSQKKKNPTLSISNQGHDEPFVSKFRYYLSCNKIDFASIRTNKNQSFSRETFDSYPIYLQHTLFINGEDFKKVRAIECCSRFLAYEELREKGNTCYYKGEYSQSLEFYQRAVSLFRWLEYKQMSNNVLNKSMTSQCNSEESGQSKVRLPLQTEQADPLNELQEKYKQFFIAYHDENVLLRDGEEMQDKADVDMRTSLLLQLYLNMAAAYIQLNHFSLARTVLRDALGITQNVSQVHFRIAQTYSLCLDSTLEELALAKQTILKAIEMKPKQKLFSLTNGNVLKMLNLHDVDQAYAQELEKINQRIQAKKIQQKTIRQKIIDRAKQIHLAEKQIIKRGQEPREKFLKEQFYSTIEMRVLTKMINKYIKVIEYYTEANNKESLRMAKKELQHTLSILNNVKQIYSSKIAEDQNNEMGGIETEKIQKRILTIKSNFASEAYEQGKYNFTLMEWAIKEVVKEDQKIKNTTVESQQVKPSQKSMFLNKLPFCLLLVPISLVAAGFFLI